MCYIFQAVSLIRNNKVNNQGIRVLMLNLVFIDANWVYYGKERKTAGIADIAILILTTLQSSLSSVGFLQQEKTSKCNSLNDRYIRSVLVISHRGLSPVSIAIVTIGSGQTTAFGEVVVDAK